MQGGSIIRTGNASIGSRLGGATSSGSTLGDGAKLRPTSASNVRGMGSLRPDPCAKGG